MAAVGSSLGAGAAGMSAAGAWAKDAKAGKPLRFIYIVLVSAPITQTVYGFLVMTQMAEHIGKMGAHAGALLGIGIATGLGEMLSAWMQGCIGAAGCRMLSDSEGKGFAFILIALGIAETVGIFTLVFMSILLAGLK
jgi:V/A-type H+-transporting ATPase subunit K